MVIKLARLMRRRFDLGEALKPPPPNVHDVNIMFTTVSRNVWLVYIQYVLCYCLLGLICYHPVAAVDYWLWLYVGVYLCSCDNDMTFKCEKPAPVKRLFVDRGK